MLMYKLNAYLQLKKQQMLAIACEQRDILFSLLYVEACCETKRW